MKKENSQLLKNKELACRLLEGTKREGIGGLVSWLCSSDYFTAPASTRLDYHGCHEGGLAEHSLNVYRIFDEKRKSLGLDVRDDESVIASLMHDACKVGIYVPNVLKSQKASDTKPYKKEDSFPFGHGERSVLYVSRHLALTETEMLLMRWHMGPYDSSWEDNVDKVEKVCPAIYAFHNADMEASKYLDVKRHK